MKLLTLILLSCTLSSALRLPGLLQLWPQPTALPLPLHLPLLSQTPIFPQPSFGAGALPFIVLHGIGDACSFSGMNLFVSILERLSGANGTCIEIGNGADDSWTMRLDHQAQAVCQQVVALPHLQGGFNLVALSQGALLGRAVIQTCDGAPQVHNFVSLGGPHAGVASTPTCTYTPLCRLIDLILRLGIYASVVQDNVAPAGYVKIPTDESAYLQGCKFLPHINNELPALRNATYAARFSAINRLILVKFSEDTVLFPRDTAHFGFFVPNSFTTLQSANQTQLYLEDWVGLRALVTQHKVEFVTLPGNHLVLPLAAINSTIVPFLLPST